MTAVNVLIIGLGNIGALYDIDDPSNIARTHLGAVFGNQNYKIVALVEPDAQKRQTVREHYKLNDGVMFEALSDIPEDVKIDLAIFAASPHEREDNIDQIAAMGARFCVFEKPVAETVPGAKAIKALCEKKNIQAIINFNRRYDVGINAFKDALPSGHYPEKIVTHYSKGIKNYGSHALDLLMDFYGGIKSVQATASNNATDPLIDGVLNFENGAVAHLISHNTNYDLFDFEFYYADKKFSLSQGTTKKYVQTAQKNLIYKNYSHLAQPEVISETQKIGGLIGLYEDVAEYFKDTNYKTLGCSLTEALSGMTVIEALINSAKNGQEIEL